MGGLSIWHWLVVGIAVMLLFGKGRFSDMMGDVAKGIKSFKSGMSDEEDKPARPARLESTTRPAEPVSERDRELERERVTEDRDPR